MKENTEYLELFIIVDNTKFQQGQENLLFFHVDGKIKVHIKVFLWLLNSEPNEWCSYQQS